MSNRGTNLSFFRCALLLFVSFSLYSQDAPEAISTSYVEYVGKQKEGLFLTLNKEGFYRNEDLYFSAFLKNYQELVAPSSMLQIKLYNSEGIKVASHLFPVVNNASAGSFLLSMAAGKYLLEAATVSKEGVFISNVVSLIFPVYETDEKIEAGTVKKERILYVQPEGGTLVADFENNIAFYVSNVASGGDRIIDLQLEDEMGNVLLDAIPFLDSGFGKFPFIPRLEKKYTLFVTFESGEIIKQQLPRAITSEVYFQTNNLLEERLLLSYQFSANFKEIEKNDEVIVAIHNYESITISSAKLLKENGAIQISKEQLFPQLNIISVFNTSKELLYERFLYHDVPREPLLEVSIAEQVSDSLTLTVSNINEVVHSSVSIQPIKESTDVFIPKHSELLGAFGKELLLDDLLFSTITNRKRAAEIDLLCLSLGSSHLLWDEILTNSNVPSKKIQGGFKVKGAIKGEVPATAIILMYQRQNGAMYTSKMNSDGSFVVEDAYIFKDENLYFSSQPNFLKPKTIEVSIQPRPNEADTLRTDLPKGFKNWLKDTVVSAYREQRPLIRSGDQVSLDTVVVAGKKKSNEFQQNEALLNSMYEPRKINKDVLKRNRTLAGYIRRLGFRVGRDPATNDLIISGRSYYDNAPIIYLDGFITRDPIQDLPLDSIDEVYFEHMGVEGSNGGTLYIYRNKGRSISSEESIIGVNASAGYTRPVMYENPLLVQTKSPFQLVHWEPSLLVNSLEATISFPHYNYKEFEVTFKVHKKNGSYEVVKRVIRLEKN